MDIGLVFSAAETLFAALNCSELKEICSKLGHNSYKFQLHELQGTVSTVRAVLRDAETKERVSNEAQIWFEDLKDAVYDADDLLDEFTTLAKKKQLYVGEKAGKVSHFFSRLTYIGVAFKMSREVKRIREQLEAIAINHSLFGLTLDSEPIRRRKKEKCSYFCKGDIIGREDDLEKIVGILLDENVQSDVSFLFIVGIGGLGKTALAHLVYNDARVNGAFPLKMWTSVSDRDQDRLDEQEIYRNILASANSGVKQEIDIHLVQSELQKKLACHKYLLVLDDVWTEKRYDWIDLVKIFKDSQKGSRIVVTTRSKETARVVGSGANPMYELQGLPTEDSWKLFVKMAFEHEESIPNDLDEIGREIVERCAGVPLALRVVGSLLYGQRKSRWQYVQEMGLANIRESQNDIMPILKLSYMHLDSSLKSCFCYCALFPKGFEIQKEMLISLWIAQGYVVPLDKDQSTEDAAEEYFNIFLQRCFFQDVRKDEFGEVISCKIHDLMHDIAQNVAGREICVTNSITNNIDKKVRHLALMRSESTKYSFTKTQIRSFLQKQVSWEHYIEDPQFDLDALLGNFKCVRVLDLSRLNFETLPTTIGKLLHLRYLDLSWNIYLTSIPASFKKLYNLESLILSGCSNLRDLPIDMNKMINLRVLDVRHCSRLTCMPRGMGKLTSLHTMPYFVLGDASLSWKQWYDCLEDIKVLKNLKGSLCLKILLPVLQTNKKRKILSPNDVMMDDKGERGGYLKNKGYLTHISLNLMSLEEDDKRAVDTEKMLLEELQPHCNLKKLEVSGYHGVRLPGWVMLLPNLVSLELENCEDLQHLAGLGNLQQLKFLKLKNMPKLEYIVENNCVSTGSSNATNAAQTGLSSVEGSSFFPSLVQLELINLMKLKGWGRLSRMANDYQPLGGSSRIELDELELICLSQLKSLDIMKCSELTAFPRCPQVERLSIRIFNERLRIIKFSYEVATVAPSSTSNPNPSYPPSESHFVVRYLKDVTVDNVAWLESLPIGSLQKVSSMYIVGDKKVEKIGKELLSCSSSLRNLCISYCEKLTIFTAKLEYFTALEELVISATPLRLHRFFIVRPWKSFSQHTLRSLELRALLQLRCLPYEIRNLRALELLEIWECKNLYSMPSWMPDLTSLKELRIRYCSDALMKRCNNLPIAGEDWPLIQHIPRIFLDWSKIER